MALAKGFKIHFLGASGEGISALIELCAFLGCDVSGSDLDITKPNAQRLLKICNLMQQEQAEIDKDTDLVVYSLACKSDNPVLDAANQMGIKTIDRSYFTVDYVIPAFSQRIFITGCNGKTSTTYMVSKILQKNNYNHCALVGGTSLDDNTNCIISSYDQNIPQCLVLELDDSNIHLMNMQHSIDVLIMTNFGYDHMEVYKSKNKLIDAYSNVIHHAKHKILHCSCMGALVHNDCDNLHVFCEDDMCTQSVYPHYLIKDIKIDDNGSAFNIISSDADNNISSINNVHNSLKGTHYAINSLACYIFTLIYKINFDLSNLCGIARRMQFLRNGNATVISDYIVHHAAIESALKNVRLMLPSSKIITVFEPHRYARLHYHYSNIVNTLYRFSDYVMITDMFTFYQKHRYSKLYNNLLEIFTPYTHEAVHDIIDSNDKTAIIFMGAGNAHRMAIEFNNTLDP